MEVDVGVDGAKARSRSSSRGHEQGAEDFSDSESVRETTVLGIVVIVTVGTLFFSQKNTGVGL